MNSNFFKKLASIKHPYNFISDKRLRYVENNTKNPGSIIKSNFINRNKRCIILYTMMYDVSKVK